MTSPLVGRKEVGRKSGGIASVLALWQLAAALLLVLVILLLAADDLHDYTRWRRGQETGLRWQIDQIDPRLGVNVELDQYADEASLLDALEKLHQAGFRTLRQRFAWADIEPEAGQYLWSRWDSIVELVQSYGFDLVAVIDTSPGWARPAWEQENPYAPPRAMADYAHFVGILASRYGPYIDAYQIWDSPNIAPHWGQGPIDPAGYVRMLQEASRAIRENDPSALIVAGGLAPNTESGGLNMSESQFLQELYRRGAADAFDVLGVQAFGFWSGPEDRRVSAKVLNLSRTILLREEMRRRGDADKPIWAVEFGWCALPPDWQGDTNAAGSDSPFVQAERLDRALTRVKQEWPWMNLLFAQQPSPNTPPTSSRWGYALFRADDTTSLFLPRMVQHIDDSQILYPGWTDSPRTHLLPDAAPQSRVITFWGTELTLEIDPAAQGQLVALNNLSLGSTVIDLAHGARQGQVTVLRAPTPNLYTVRLRGSDAELAAITAMRVGNVPNVLGLAWMLTVTVLALSWLGLSCFRAARRVRWRRGWSVIAQPYARLHWVIRWLPLAGSALLIAQPLSGSVRLLGLLSFGLWALLQPQNALAVAVASIPWAPIHVAIGPAAFSVTELALLIAAVAWVWQRLLGEAPGVRTSIRSLAVMDWLVILLVTLGIGASLMSEYRHVALRELRLVIFEPALLYLLLRRSDSKARRRLVGILLASVTLVAVYALASYPFDSGVIEAEGVRRARAFYGSPNNLALMVERLLPLALVLSIGTDSNRRRWLLGLSAGLMALTLILTFSRGAWLFAVPGALAVILIVRAPRVRWVALVCIVIIALLWIPLSRIPRFASLFDLQSGTAFLRVQLWRASLDMIRDHLWLGVGPDNFLYYYGDYIYAGAEVDRWLNHPHNILLDFWLSLGVGGALTLIAILVLFVKQSVRAIRSPRRQVDRAVALGLLASTAGALAHGLIDASFFVPELAYWFMSVLAWMQSLAGERAEE